MAHTRNVEEVVAKKEKIKKAFGPKMSQAKKQKMKKKKSFPDLNKDGKVTFADVLKGRGVNKKA